MQGSTQMSDSFERWKNSMEHKKWKIARFYTLYCDTPTDPNEISDESVLEFEKIFSTEKEKSSE
jgi:hypothetical protein